MTEKLLRFQESSNKTVNILFCIVQVKSRASGRRNAQPLHARLSTGVACSHSNSFPKEDRRDIVRLDFAKVKCYKRCLLSSSIDCEFVNISQFFHGISS